MLRPLSRAFWYTLLAAGAIFLLVFYVIANFFVEHPTNLAEQELLAIKANKLKEAYYNYTSKEFQENNSFEKFEEFVHSTPLVRTFETLTVEEPSYKGDQATQKALLESPGAANAEVLFILKKEDNKWKIFGIQLTEYEKTEEESTTATADLIAPIEKQLKALHEKDLLGAYKDIFSKDFAAKFSFEQFETFVASHPILTTYTQYDFKEHYTLDDGGIVTVILNPDSDKVAIHYQLVKEDNQWKVVQMRVTFPTKNTSPEANNMISLVRQQLEALQRHDYAKAYSDLSNDLQKATPFNLFRSFVQHYPAFINYKRLNIVDPDIEDNIGRLSAELENEEGLTVVSYAVGLEDGKWKILGVHVDQTPKTKATTVEEGDIRSFNTRELLTVIQGFLKALGEKNLEKARSQYTSTFFQQENSLSAFEEFVSKHPELVKNTSSNFEKLMFNNNIATFSGTLALPEDKELPVEFDLIQENEQWKILHIFTHPIQPKSAEKPPEAPPQALLELTKVVLGSKVNELGIIDTPSTTFKQDSGDIFANLYVHGGNVGDVLTIELRHMESGSSIPKVSATVQEEGDSVITLIFSPPPKGWPKGNYQIRTTFKEHAFNTTSFVVE